MASILDSIAQQQERDDNQAIAGAQHDLNWTSTFRSTPPAEVSRARANYTDAIDRALSNKIALQARTDIGALRLQQKAAEHEEWVKQAPMREQLLRAHIDATGATERRKAEESRMEMTHTTNLNRGMLDFYKNGGQPGTPEAQQTFLGLVADNPLAHPGHLAEIGKSNGFGELPPEELASRAAKQKQALIDAGLSNPVVSSTKAGLTFREGKAEVSAAQKTADIVNRVKEVAAARGVPPTVTNLYSAKLGEISGLSSKIATETDEAKKDLLRADKYKNEELIRSLEAIHPELRKTRGLDAPAAPDAAQTPPSGFTEEQMKDWSPERRASYAQANAAPAAAETPKEAPEQIAARIKAAGGTKEDFIQALKDAGHNL